MKITRRQLRKLINEIRVKPGGDMDPEHVEKITAMIDSGDEDYIEQADELASMVGHDAGDSFSQALKRYDHVSVMGEIGEFITYLTDEDIQLLMNVKGKDLRYGLHSWAGFGFDMANPDGYGIGKAISPNEFYDMQFRIAAKKRDIDDNDIAEHEGMDTGVDAAHKLAQAVMSLSRKTYVSQYTIEDAGIAEEREEGGFSHHRSTPLRRYKASKYDFYEPEYEQLYKAGKLVIK